jgi:hypothetical protein
MGKHSLSLQALQGTDSSKGLARTLAMVSVAPSFCPSFTSSTQNFPPPTDFVLFLERWNFLSFFLSIDHVVKEAGFFCQFVYHLSKVKSFF